MAIQQEQLHTKVTADASQAKSEMGSLKKGIDDVGQAGDSMGEKFAASLAGLTRGLKDFGLAVNGIQQGVAIFKAGLDIADEVTQMESLERAIPKGAIDGLRKATQGLISYNDTLRLGVKGLTGDFKLTEQQMETVLRTAVALQERGFGPAAQNADKLVEALAKGVNKLDDFGISLQKTGNHQNDVNAALAKFDDIIGETGPIDERQASLAELNRTLEDVSRWMKQVVAEVVVGIAKVVASGRQAAADIAKGKKDHPGWSDLANPAFMTAALGESYELWKYVLTDQPSAPRGVQRDPRDPVPSFPGRNSPGAPKTIDMSGDPMIIGRSPPKKPPTHTNAMEDQAYSGRGFGEAEGLGAPAPYFDPMAQLSGLGSRNPSMAERLGIQTGRNINGGNAADALKGAMGGESIEDLVGKLDKLKQLKAELGDTSTALGGAFAAVSAGVTAAVDAAITGSDSIGKAAAKASAMVLKSLSIEAAGRAVYEGALALGALAVGDAAGASLHGAAAAQAAAAAALMGAGAAALGSASGAWAKAPAKGGGAGAGGGYVKPATGGSDKGETIIINIGDGFVGDPDAAARKVARAVRDAKRRGVRDDYTSTYSG